jgi:hypothetical protein
LFWPNTGGLGRRVGHWRLFRRKTDPDALEAAIRSPLAGFEVFADAAPMTAHDVDVAPAQTLGRSPWVLSWTTLRRSTRCPTQHLEVIDSRFSKRKPMPRGGPPRDEQRRCGCHMRVLHPNLGRVPLDHALTALPFSVPRRAGPVGHSSGQRSRGHRLGAVP